MSSSSSLFEPRHAIFAPPIAGAPPITTSNITSPGSPTTHPLVLPSCYHNSVRCLIQISHDPIKQKEDLRLFMRHDLNVTRLNDIHKHLWLAGLPHPPRGLNVQIMLGRTIILTDRADLHLLWRDRELYLKPLPEYLLSHSTWTDILLLPGNNHLYASATGLLYSYINLLPTKADLHIAQQHHLLSKSITYAQWTAFTSAVLTSLNSHSKTSNSTPSILNKRYIYGELRLTRINFISRFSPPFKLLNAHHNAHTTYTTFFSRNFAWLITTTIYVTVVLTAMQVGLATTTLSNSGAFQNVSFGFTVFAIVGPLAVVAAMGVLGLGLVVWNGRFALTKRVMGVGVESGGNAEKTGGGSGMVNGNGV